MYHVVGANALSTYLSNGQVITTLNGEDVTVAINADGVFINEAQVTVADLTAENGVVHVINAVLLPPTVRNKNSDFDLDVAINPNPTRDVLNVVFGVQDAYLIQLFNTAGQIIYQEKVSSQFTRLEVTDYNPGMYLLKVSSNEGSTVRIIVKQ